MVAQSCVSLVKSRRTSYDWVGAGMSKGCELHGEKGDAADVGRREIGRDVREDEPCR